MVWRPMEGVKVLEVAQFTFAPSAGAVLADWGAAVVKVEHAEHGDAQRGLKIGSGGVASGSFQPLMEHPNRGKRSIGLALEVPSGRDVLMELVQSSDVFLTNFLPDARRRLRIDAEDIRVVNPDIIYVRGSGHGQRGPELSRPGYDGSTFWSRMGCAWGVTPPDSGRLFGPAVGCVRRLHGRSDHGGWRRGGPLRAERTGEGSIVDVSLMSVGAWAMALWLGTAMLTGESAPPLPTTAPPHIAVNPTIGSYKTADGRFITLMMVQPGRYFADLCRHVGLEHLLDDERFQTAEGLMEQRSRGRPAPGRRLCQATVQRLGRAPSNARRPVGTGAEPRRGRGGFDSSTPMDAYSRWSTPPASNEGSSQIRSSSTSDRRWLSAVPSSRSTPTTSCASSARLTRRSCSSSSTVPAPESTRDGSAA